MTHWPALEAFGWPVQRAEGTGEEAP
jgi:hypothetical protein